MLRIVLQDWRQPLSARSLVLWSLSTAAPAPVRATHLIERAAIFELEPTAMRMATGRLVRENMAIATTRGTYVLGPAAAAIHAKARGWPAVERRVRPWTGDWILTLTGHLGRKDRSRLQRRERALRLSGFAPFTSGTWLRPDNLHCGLDIVTKELIGLGLDDEAVVLGQCKTQLTPDAAMRALWPREAIETGYRFSIGELAQSTRVIERLALCEAAREALMLGQAVIRAINSDPLLPAELVDSALRGEMVEAMVAYDALGRALWERIDRRSIPDLPSMTEQAA